MRRNSSGKNRENNPALALYIHSLPVALGRFHAKPYTLPLVGCIVANARHKKLTTLCKAVHIADLPWNWSGSSRHFNALLFCLRRLFAGIQAKYANNQVNPTEPVHSDHI